MNGTEKDHELTKRLFATPDEQVKILRKELQQFILNQCPEGWTQDQVEMLTLNMLLKHAAYYASELDVF